ncbi:hypothetical protein [Terricaulis silvestris]|uniref:Lipoprotein n=1 Tax=Terricaulis silvestris TaxID=2686094 RepID=A0A6I6MM11_9CAUL|nr:hypothetical protein [Terricaulis silvestris]QGZ95061.1 hypothetical protein DSM104635_01901 [Terricaulis silvestris]
MRKVAFAALLVLSACAFSSERAFFGAADASQPIADGARYVWQAPGDEVMDVTFQLRGAEYELTERNHADDTLAGLLFIDVPETSADDYIVQWQQEQGSDVRIYAFMWADGAGYRIYSSPSAFDAPDGSKPTEAYCQAMAYGECRFTTREQLLAFYQNVVYPALAGGSVTSDDYLELTPFADAAPDRK